MVCEAKLLQSISKFVNKTMGEDKEKTQPDIVQHLHRTSTTTTTTTTAIVHMLTPEPYKIKFDQASGLNPSVPDKIINVLRNLAYCHLPPFMIDDFRDQAM